MEAAIFRRIGMRFVAGVDERSLECRLETDLFFEEVRPLGDMGIGVWATVFGSQLP
jgi:hypothetical protein